ncbi:hypothetical protein BDV34DRAFT_219088 [Aspergillus parasiticus]|uniref:Fucose-specific lectin n=1 Tax=Aspergillus parasiticus TaxID=5067 RepID=A0A5N6E2X1_ASPPA|nr:hypothetical protein BDV34DRAFT_219088 [Aspergillus parasiticus]
MSGLASIANPLDPNAAAIQVYYVAQDGNLAMAFKTGGASSQTKEDKYHAGANDHEGHIVSPSHLAVGYFQGAQFVVGYTNPKPAVSSGTPAPPETHNISIISPVYEPIVKGVGLDKRALTFTANKDIASIWYLREKHNQTVLCEYRLRDRTHANDGKMKNIHSSSALAGYIVDKDVFVVYQSDDGELFEYQSGGDWVAIDAGHEPVEKTTLAVNYVQEKKAAYLYYRTSKGALIRMTKRKDEKWDNSKKIPTDNVAVGPNSQLAVVYSNGINHIYWVPEGATEPKEARDNL